MVARKLYLPTGRLYSTLYCFPTDKGSPSTGVMEEAQLNQVLRCPKSVAASKSLKKWG